MFFPEDTLLISHFLTHALMARKIGFDVVVLARKTSETNREQICANGCVFYDSKIKRASTSVYSVVVDLLNVFSVLLKEKPDVIHNFGNKQILFGTLFSRLCFWRRIYVINYLTGLGFLYTSCTNRAKILRRVVEFAFRFLLKPKRAKVVCENPDDIKYFIRKRILTRNDVYLVKGAGVDADKYRPLPWSGKRRTITIVMSSRLLRSKGVIDYLKAAKILKKDQIPVDFWLIGDVDNANPDSLTTEEISKWKGEHICHFFGYRSDVDKLIPQAHIFVLPSYREGLSKSLLEAAACGLAIITTDAIGCRDVVANNNGFVVPLKDSVALASAIKRLVSNEELIKEMGLRSRALALQQYSTEVISRQIQSLYTRVINEI